MEAGLASNRSFGGVFTAFFALAGTYLWWQGGTLHPWLFGLAGLTAAAALARPGLLAPFNRVWMKFGELLHHVVSPVVLGVIFFGVFTPVALVMRLAGRDILKRRYEPETPSYWVERTPPGPAADSFRDQF